ncbi:MULTISPECIES: MFS transporter [Kocuria]|uniref:MFS transporter n=1 Tax=Kocuria subflava TaxID=1736139 RepID=A0A846TUM8_9MICC|nr:MFS transporter [Kocuria sp. CPCC 104605]NKE10750.1 MFS transporter [Kocuria subflava]
MNATATQQPVPVQMKPSQWSGVAYWGALGAATFMASLDNLVVTMALPHVQQQFSTSLQGLTWAINAYTLPFAIFMLAAVIIGDRWGRRRVFAVGVILFGLGSVVAASAPNYEFFVAARAIQGVGGAFIVPLALTLLISSVSTAQRPLVIAILSGIQGLGIALGPFAGGLIISMSHWNWIFWINVPISIIVLALTLFIRPQRSHTSGVLPLVSLVLLSIGLLGTAGAALAFSSGTRWTFLWLVVAVGGLGAGVVNVLRKDQPALPAALFRSRGFVRTNITALLVTAGIFGVVFVLTQYLQVAMNYSPLQAGLATLPWTLLPAISAPLAGMAAPRTGIRPLIVLSTILQIFGLGWFLLTIHPEAPYLLLLPGMVMAGLGMGVFFALITGQAVSFASRSMEGVATGINTSIREAGVLIGVAGVGAAFVLGGGGETPQEFQVGLPSALIASITLLLIGLAGSIVTPREPDPSESLDDTPPPTV